MLKKSISDLNRLALNGNGTGRERNLHLVTCHNRVQVVTCDTQEALYNGDERLSQASNSR